jgi:predicted Zn-dependent peptidase
MLFHTEFLGEIEFENRVKELGGSYNAFTYLPFTRFFIYLPKDHVEEGLSLLWQVVFNQSLRSDRVVDVKQVIDRENGWSDSTWFDRLQKMFEAPEYLREPGFWQNQFNFALYDRSAGGVKEIARQLTLEDAEKFRQRFYRTPNMTAVYVGPHQTAEVKQVLSQLAKTMPGLSGGGLNIRENVTARENTVQAYRNFEFNDQDPSMTMGFLFNDMGFDDSPYLTLYTEMLKRFLYENVRHESAQTYSVQSAVEIYRGLGYLTFQSQASRLSFARVHRFIGDVLWNRDFHLISEDRFLKTKNDYMKFVRSRLHQPEFLDAYLGFLIRAHRTHILDQGEIDWLGRLSSVDYDDLRNWRARKLNPAARYEYLEAPSAFIPYEILPLLLIVGFIIITFWKRLLLNPADIRFVQLSINLGSFPWGLLYSFLVYYCAYWITIHLFFAFNRGLEAALRGGMPLYLSGYVHGAIAVVILVSMIVLAGALVPRRLLMTRDRMTVKSALFASFSWPVSSIVTVEKIGRLGFIKERAVPLNLFFKPGVLIRFKNSRPVAFGVRDLTACLQLLEVAIRSEGRDFRQLSFPGMHIKKIDPTNLK